MDKATREALRLPTQRKATALMNEVEIERQKAAAKGDYQMAQWLRTQIYALGQSSIAADREAVDNFEIAWNKRKAEQKAEADKAQKAIEPPSDPVARLNAARKLQARRDKA
jgi:hypothetical protein